MGVLTALRDLGLGDDGQSMYECRTCGETVDQGADADCEALQCPGCGSTEIAHYEL